LKNLSGLFEDFLISYSQGVAETKTICLIFRSNSSNLRGLLSIAEGRRNQASTKFFFLALSQAYIQSIWLIVI
jgi:hypothetical protein